MEEQGLEHFFPFKMRLEHHPKACKQNRCNVVFFEKKQKEPKGTQCSMSRRKCPSLLWGQRCLEGLQTAHRAASGPDLEDAEARFVG